ncbi:Asp_protease_2 domain-containing protein [Cucumis melo var. makuwa]|uniref:Asp_protease_2 domain-containing protein n=1 Tax=Cucumis melo var. makuwa TaxID=1194695 RepID=A0A5A7VLT5_CUCMM|nr:Asp_protease_2 domain-containing protein [Cucumis melo var. makuwa]
MERGLLYVDTWTNQKQTKSTMIDSSATHNFITDAEARHLRLHWEKDSERMKVVNFVTLYIVRLVKRTTIKLRRWKGLVDFMVVKMDDFDLLLGMEFLLEHQVIPMPSVKCLVITGSFPIEPPSVAIPLGALGKVGETVPKDTLCIPEKYHGAMPKSWPKSLSMRRMIDHGIESPPEAKAPGKNAHRTMPPALADLQKLLNRLSGVKYFPKSNIRPRYCRVRATEEEGLETTCVTELRACESYVVPFSLIDANGGKYCSAQSVVLRSCPKLASSNRQSIEEFLKRASSLTELLKEEDIQWGGNLECQAAFDGLRQATIERPSLGVAGATKPPKVETEQFNLCLEEASRSMKERVDQKRCPLEFEWMIKLSINSAITPPTREIHKFLVKWKNPLVEVTSGEHVEDLEAWKQKTEELQLCQLTGTSTV